MDIKRDEYIFLDVTWSTGFNHIVPCRGFNLQSQLKFSKSLDYVKDVTYRVVTEKEYMELLWPSSEVADTESKNSTTSSTSQPKNGKSPKKVGSKQSPTKASVKTVTKSTKARTQSSKAKPKNSTGSLERKTDGTRSRKTETLKETPAKRKPRQKASEDSKAVSKPQRASKPDAKRTASNGKDARSELRKPKVSNVRKSKKDVQGTNDSGEAPLPRTRGRKAKTQ